jgi:hypothetical protein
MAEKDRKGVEALNLELEKVFAGKSAAFSAWLTHRRTHDGQQHVKNLA